MPYFKIAALKITLIIIMVNHQLALAEPASHSEIKMLQFLQQAEIAIQQTDYPAALEYNDHALAAGQRLNVAEYRWQQYQQRAIILQALGKGEKSLAYWQQAIEQLNRIQQWGGETYLGQAEMQTAVMRYVDQLLMQQESDLSFKIMQKNFITAIHVYDSLKRGQIAEYLEVACIIPNQTMHSLLKQNKHVAVIYPIALQNRMEMLIDIGGIIYRHRIQQKPVRITKLIKRFYSALSHQQAEYRRYGKALYSILLKPIIPLLQAADIHTLVWVQDSSFSGLPLAALQNQANRFVIEDYAVVMSPSISLLSSEVRLDKPEKILIAGLAQAQKYKQQEFPGLAGINKEISWLSSHFQSDRLVDENFTREKLISQLQQTNYDIVHLASHAQIGVTMSDSFLLANNGAIPLSELENILTARRFATHPLELLTLSACQTAASMKDATLGLGGLLVKTGARSVLASLWPVDDRATALLMQYFYIYWGANNKAQALQLAQQQLLNSPHQHPFYWSGFILTGHWD